MGVSLRLYVLRSKQHSSLQLTEQKISVHSWDATAPVYVSIGADTKPGVAEIDDNGNGVVDELLELGATGSDDVVLTPGDMGYEDAVAGKVTAIVLSYGAMRPVEGDQMIEGPGQVRIDLIGEGNAFRSRIIDLLSAD